MLRNPNCCPNMKTALLPLLTSVNYIIGEYPVGAMTTLTHPNGGHTTTIIPGHVEIVSFSVAARVLTTPTAAMPRTNINLNGRGGARKPFAVLLFVRVCESLNSGW